MRCGGAEGDTLLCMLEVVGGRLCLLEVLELLEVRR